MEIEDRLTTMEKRLHNQEKRLRYHRITVGILVLFIMLMVGTRVGANSGVLTCTELRVVDTEGKPQVRLGADADGGWVASYSPEGETLVSLGATASGNAGAVETYSPEGKMLVRLGAYSDGNGAVWTTTKSGRLNRLD